MITYERDTKAKQKEHIKQGEDIMWFTLKWGIPLEQNILKYEFLAIEILFNSFCSVQEENITICSATEI